MKRAAVLTLGIMFAIAALVPAMAIDWPWGPKPNEDVQLVLKVAKGEADAELHDQILYKGISYIREFVDLKAMVKEARFQKTRFVIATKKFAKINDSEQLVDIAGMLKNGNANNQRYRDSLLKKGAKHIKDFAGLRLVVAKAEHVVTREALVREKFVKIKTVTELVEISKYLWNLVYSDGSIKAAYKDKVLLDGAQKLATTKTEVITVAGAAQTDYYRAKILKINPSASSPSPAPQPTPEPVPAPEPAPMLTRGHDGCTGGTCPLPDPDQGGQGNGNGGKKISAYPQQCPLCHGTGKLGLKTCPACHGAGWDGPMMMAALKGDGHDGCTGGTCPLPEPTDPAPAPGKCGPDCGTCPAPCPPPAPDPAPAPGKCGDDCGGCPAPCPPPAPDPAPAPGKCGDDCGGCPAPCPPPAPAPDQPGDKCNGHCTGCGGCAGGNGGNGNGGNGGKCGDDCGGCPAPCPAPAPAPDPDQGKSAYDDKFIEEYLKAKILNDSNNGDAKGLLIEIFRHRENN